MSTENVLELIYWKYLFYYNMNEENFGVFIKMFYYILIYKFINFNFLKIFYILFRYFITVLKKK